MATAYKCDRCGEYFDGYEPGLDLVAISISSGGLFGRSKGYDLCPSCQEKIEKFLGGVEYDVMPVMSTEE